MDILITFGISILVSFMGSYISYHYTKKLYKQEQVENESWNQYQDIKNNIIGIQSYINDINSRLGLLHERIEKHLTDENTLKSIDLDLPFFHETLRSFNILVNNLVDYTNLYSMDDQDIVNERDPARHELSISLAGISQDARDDHIYLNDIYERIREISLVYFSGSSTIQIPKSSAIEIQKIIADVRASNYKMPHNTQQMVFYYFKEHFSESKVISSN